MIKEGVILSRRYEIGVRIGAGGMADVYRAKDLKLNRYVAVKVLKPEFREDATFVKKFQTEAQSAAGLMHPNVVNVYDVGEDRGLYYIVMELVEGITLKEYIEKKGRLSAKEVISIAIQICAGINAAHEKQIIHRDIKPQNVIISKEGKVKVTDFGIAKAATSKTVTTNVLGSVHYTSPEQARGGISDVKSDIYSTGITLFEMVTGQVPFDGDSAVAVAVKHLNESIQMPSMLVPDVPYSLEQIIIKCTQKNPACRYQTMTELIDDLKRSLVDPEGNFVQIHGTNGPLGDTVMAGPVDYERYRREGRNPYEEEYDYEPNYSRDYEDRGYGDTSYIPYDTGEERKNRRLQEEEEETPGMSRLMKIMIGVVAVVAAIGIIFLVSKATGLFKMRGNSTTIGTEKENMTKMPDVRGKTRQEAIEILNKHNLGYKTPMEKASSEKYEAGVICRQDVEPGKEIKKNTRIQLTISTGPKKKEFSMPDVAGLSEEEAIKMLTQAGLEEGNITPKLIEDDTVEEGKVVKTSPASEEKVTKTSKVTLYISKGKSAVSVPSLTGKTKEEAVSLLQQASLAVGNVTEEFSDKAAGVVLSQGINRGTKVDKGTAVDFVISKGEKPKANPTVPDIIRSTEANARASLTNAGFSMSKVYEYNDAVGAGLVFACEPGVGTQLEEHSTVTVYISKGAKPASGNHDDDSNASQN